ncbi:MAG: AAA-like domain-containing protein [Candidatus Aminicenantes bacterium]
MMNSFEALQYPFSFWWTYIICMSFVFSAEIGTKALSFSGKEYASFQKSAIFWGPILALFIYLESQSEKVAMKDPLVIIALGFLVIPLFIAHRAKAWKKEVSFLPPAEIYWYLSRGEWHLSVAIRELEKKKGYRFNEEMIKTLQAALGFQRCKTLKDIETACMVLEEIKEFPAEIDYFVFFEKRIPQLSNVKDALLSIDSIDGIEGRRDLLSHQKRNLEVLLQNVQEELFEPFKDIWERGLKKSIGIIEAEIKRLQNFPALSIDLKNKDSSVSAEAQNLYFEVHNKANKLALDASINSLEVVEGPIYLADTPRKKIAVIESDAVKEISWPMRAKANGKAIVRGSFTFSDRAGENYLMDFSFPVTVKKRSTQFKEIKNPYTVGQPLKGDDPHYFGREDAYDFIDKNITAPGNGHIIVYGLRRTGKTSILHRIESKGFTDQRLVPVTLGIQGIADEKDFFYSLSTGIKEKLSLSSGAAVENFGSFRQFIKEIKPELGERTIVLMIDELEVLQTKVKDDRISRTFFSNLRHLMQHETKLVFLFCSIHKPEEMSVDDWSIFSNTVTNLKISRLKRNEALRLIEEPVKGQLNYDDLAVEHILKMTAGQPYLVQLICRTLVNNLNENKKRNAVLIDDVDEAVGNIIANDQDCFSRGIWQEATLLERLVLSSIAEELRLKQLERAGPGAVYERIQTVTPKFAGRHVLGALEKLADREILAEKDEHYSFPVSLLHKWISTRCPLRKVREKIQLKVKMS